MLKNVMKVLHTTHSFLTLVRHPTRLDVVFNLSHQVDDRNTLQKMRECIEQTDSGKEALMVKARLGKVDMQALDDLPAGTLGKEFAQHMISRNLKLEDIPTLPTGDDLDFIRAHLYETHDIWHVATGFDTDVAGELGLQAFYFGQMPTVFSGFLLSSGLLNTSVYTMSERSQRMNEITRGWEMAKKSKPLFGVQWSALWKEPLEEVRGALSLQSTAPAVALHLTDHL